MVFASTTSNRHHATRTTVQCVLGEVSRIKENSTRPRFSVARALLIRQIMANHQAFLDAFAEARRTWDDLVTLQPDILAGAGRLDKDDLAELERRVGEHYDAVQTLATVLESMWVAETR